MTATGPGRRLPILFLDRAGSAGAPHYHAAPVIQVGLRFDPQHGSGARAITSPPVRPALVDTGADLNYLDEALIGELGLPFVRNASVAGATSTVGSTSHIGHLFLHAHQHQIETDFVSAPLRKNGRQFDVVLGILFLRLGVLHMDFPRGEFHFTLP